MKHSTNTMRKLALVAAAVLPLAAQAANMIWLLPNEVQVENREHIVSVDAGAAEDAFVFQRNVTLGQLRITGPNGSRLQAENQVSSRHRQSFDVRLPDNGTYRISNLTRTLMGSYKQGSETKRFRTSPENLARELPEGAELQGLLQSTDRQETFVVRGDATPAAFAPEGDGLELVPLDAVVDLSTGDSSRFRLLLNGKPVANTDVTVLLGGNRYRYKRGDLLVKTDAQGEFKVSWTDPGVYWIGTSVGERMGRGGTGGTREKPLENFSVSATVEVLPK